MTSVQSVPLIKARANDYRYDPLFIVSGPKDYYKAGVIARMQSAKYVIQPLFYSMFSELSNVPRYKVVMVKPEPIAPFQTETAKSIQSTRYSMPDNVKGKDYVKFFRSAVSLSVSVPELTIPETPTTCRSEKDDNFKTKMTKKNVKIQTKYRESSAQTSPWEPDFVVMADTDPEILKLDFLKWGSGLPCGTHEVTLIQRARMKREWEKNLPPCDTPENLAKREALITAMERDEWAFREQEIQDIQDLRLHLLELMLEELHKKSHERSEKKLKLFCEMKENEKKEKIRKIRKDTDRERRRLLNKHLGVITKYVPHNSIDEHINKKSELYVPLIRHGEHPKRWHQVIDEHLKKYNAKFRDVEAFSTLPNWLHRANLVNVDILKLTGTRLCIRETKWTVAVLKQLHDSLKNLNKHEKKKYSLRVKIDKKKAGIITPEVDSISDIEEAMHQASILLQSVIRGRAAQKLIYDGRERCKELIQELKSTQALLEKEKKKIFAEKLDVQYQQREHQLCLRSALRIKEGLKKIQGAVIGTMLDFLSKELRRLLDERKAHAMCLIYERERQIREAAEANRRQLELRRRQEHDEIFKQVIKVHQDTVDMYLQDIITEGLEFTSDEQAKLYVTSLAKKIDEGQDVFSESPSDEKEEIIADLVHNFVLPEVEKQSMRERLKKRQAKHLKVVHDTIYRKFEHLPKPPETFSEEKIEENATTEELSKDELQPEIEKEEVTYYPEIEEAHPVSEFDFNEEMCMTEEEQASDDSFPYDRISATNIDFIEYLEAITEEEDFEEN